MGSKQHEQLTASPIRSAINRLLDELARKIVEDWISEHKSQELRSKAMNHEVATAQLTLG